MMKCFALVALSAVSSALSMEDFKFLQYMAEYGKRYTTIEEFIERRELFIAIDRKIEKHNQTPQNFTMGHNKFSDWYPEEWAKLLGEKDSGVENAWCKPPFIPGGMLSYLEKEQDEEEEDEDLGKVPKSVDWVKAGMTTPIKDQG